jgi:hypothetical protein
MTGNSYDQWVSLNLRIKPEPAEWLRTRAEREHRTVTSLATHLLLTKIAEVQAADPTTPTPVAPDGYTPGQLPIEEATT